VKQYTSQHVKVFSLDTAFKEKIAASHLRSYQIRLGKLRYLHSLQGRGIYIEKYPFPWGEEKYQPNIN
jgi:hypothetical protein